MNGSRGADGSTTEPDETALDVGMSRADGGFVVRVRGELDLRTAPRLRAALRDALATPGGAVTLDLKDLEYADSVGLSILVAGHQRALTEGRPFRIRRPSAAVRRVLDVSGLLDVLDVEPAPPAQDDPALDHPPPDHPPPDHPAPRAPGTSPPPPGVDGPAGDGPEHLLVWLTGLDAGGDPPVVLDDELAPGFSLPLWLAGVHDGYPDAVTVVVFGASATSGEAVARAVLGGGERRFRGDTTPTSLQDLRRWASAVAADEVDPDAPAAAAFVHRVALSVSELAANVERHAPGWVLVDLVRMDDELLVAVTDSRPVVVPLAGEPGTGSAWRGGLDVVRAVSDAFGLITGSDTKTVWATIGVPTRSVPGDGR